MGRRPGALDPSHGHEAGEDGDACDQDETFGVVLGFEVQVDGERRKGRESPNGSNGEGPRAEAAVPDEFACDREEHLCGEGAKPEANEHNMDADDDRLNLRANKTRNKDCGTVPDTHDGEDKRAESEEEPSVCVARAASFGLRGGDGRHSAHDRRGLSRLKANFC